MITHNNKWIQARTRSAVEPRLMCIHACMKRWANRIKTANIFTYTEYIYVTHSCTHASVCSWRLDMTRQPICRNEEGGQPGVQREPAEPLSGAVGWLTRPWKAFSRSGQREPERHTEWVWERNVSETKSKAIRLVREVCELVITWACTAAWV